MLGFRVFQAGLLAGVSDCKVFQKPQTCTWCCSQAQCRARCRADETCANYKFDDKCRRHMPPVCPSLFLSVALCRCHAAALSSYLTLLFSYSFIDSPTSCSQSASLSLSPFPPRSLSGAFLYDFVLPFLPFQSIVFP